MMSDGDKLLALRMIKDYCKRVSSKEKDRVIYDLINETEIEPSLIIHPIMRKSHE